MLDRSTVFVIGAGAGAGLNMPLGDGLSEVIARNVNISFEASELTKGNRRVVDSLRDLARREKLDFDQLAAAGRMIAQGIRYTKSIDNYLNAHRDKQLVAQVGKIAIAHAILEAERGSAMWFDSGKRPFAFRDETAMRQSWMYDFFTLLQDGIVEVDNLECIFQNLSIINFNYDRCVEHFLFRAMQELYPTKGETYIADLINRNLNIIHPYGKVGNLPWQSRENAVRFGGEPMEDSLATISQNIRTYNEQIETNGELLQVRKQISKAGRIIFLGFHFHKQNMHLLTAEEGAVDSVGSTSIFATRVGRANEELPIIEKRIVGMLN